MEIWDDGQKDGPEEEPWKRKPAKPEPHGFFEPSKADLLQPTTAGRQWRFLLNDNSVSNTEWWSRLMRFLHLHHGW